MTHLAASLSIFSKAPTDEIASEVIRKVLITQAFDYRGGKSEKAEGGIQDNSPVGSEGN